PAGFDAAVEPFDDVGTLGIVQAERGDNQTRRMVPTEPCVALKGIEFLLPSFVLRLVLRFPKGFPCQVVTLLPRREFRPGITRDQRIPRLLHPPGDAPQFVRQRLQVGRDGILVLAVEAVGSFTLAHQPSAFAMADWHRSRTVSIRSLEGSANTPLS